MVQRVPSTRRNLFALAAGLALGGAATPQAGRTALVIGNGAYPGSFLRQAHGDADAMAKLLSQLKFRVLVAHNLTIRRTHIAISDFIQQQRPGDLVLIYYCGHAAQVAGRNYLIPINSDAQTERILALEAVDVLELVKQCAPQERAGVVVMLDACRINSYQRRLHAYGIGLAPVAATPGTLYAFAAEPGHTGFDGEEARTPYAAALLDVLGTPGLTIETALARARDKVFRATIEQQTPWFTSALTQPVVLAPG